MALNKKHDPRLETLILQAAVDIKRINPHIGAPQQPVPDSDYLEVERDRQELERIWEELDRERGGPASDEPAAKAVDEDRGE